MATKDYVNTRKEVENLVNNKIIPSIKDKHPSGDTTSRVNMLGFFYACGRMSALEAFLRLALIDLTGHDNYTDIEKYFKEDK